MTNPPDRHRRIGMLTVAATLAFAVTGSHAATTDFCDPSLPRGVDDPHAYRMRGDRCEGIYVREVSGDELRIASFTRWVSDFDPTRRDVLRIAWTPVSGDGGLQLRALSLARRSHYRMDTTRAMDSGGYAWRTDVLAARGLRRDNIGLVGTTRVAVGQTLRQVMLPLRVDARPADAANDRYRLIVIPQAELAGLYLRVDPLAAIGTPGPWTGDAREQGLGYYPAERAVDLAVDAQASGFYRVEVSAVFKDGGSATLEAYFHHPGW